MSATIQPAGAASPVPFNQPAVPSDPLAAYWSLIPASRAGATVWQPPIRRSIAPHPVGLLGALANLPATNSANEQLLQPGNLGRHWLGTPYIGMNKALGARKELFRTDPDCDVAAIPESVFKHIVTLTDCDLVIDATGEQAVSDVLNADLVRARRQSQEAPASLHVWLVGSGVAAQALLADNADHACFRCLRRAHGVERFRLLNPDHPAALTPANCGEGAYFAYGVGAPAMAAGLALQMCLDWVKGAPSPRFRTLRINHEATFQVKDINAVPLENCPACAAAHG